MSSVSELLDEAKDELPNLVHGEVFLLRYLFKGYECTMIRATEICLHLIHSKDFYECKEDSA